jgi:prolipoprotein diacylglyceryl transferase
LADVSIRRKEALMPVFAIPSPAQGIWYLGPLPVRAYALCIIAGIVLAIWISERRATNRGWPPGLIVDVAMWAVPFGVVGARIYHVVTDPQLYFTEGRNPWRAFAIWEGGLGIWGGVALGALGAYFSVRRQRISLRELADIVAPGLALAQAVGRWGNWFNQELFGRPTDLPWALSIDPENRPEAYAGFSTFHPTFLYESLWNLGLFFILIWAGRRFALARGRLFALYVMGYTLGRGWIEYLRIDPVNHILGLRLNDWTSLLLFVAALAYMISTRPQQRTDQDGAGRDTRVSQRGLTASTPEDRVPGDVN